MSLRVDGQRACEGWVYAVTDPKTQATTFANTLDSVLAKLISLRLPPTAVTRSTPWGQHEGIAVNERAWLQSALGEGIR